MTIGRGVLGVVIWGAGDATPLAWGHVTAFSELAEDPAGEWVAWVTIEGVGDASGLTRWSYRVPAFARDDAAWKALLQRLDPPMSPSADSRGGISRSGDVGFALLDQDGAVTSALRLDARPATALDADCAFADSTCSVTSATGIAAGDVLYLGREAVVVMGVSGTTLVVERGVLDTEREPHASGELVYTGLPSLEGRKVRLHYAANQGRTGVPMPSGNAIETHDDGRWDVLSLRLQDTSGNPVDSSREANDATSATGLDYAAGGVLGPAWTAVELDGSTSRAVLPKLGPSSGDFAVCLGLVTQSVAVDQTPLKFSRDAAIGGGTNSLLAITVKADTTLEIEFMGATRAIADTLSADAAHLVEVVVRDRGAGNGSTVWTYLDGVEVDEWAPSVRVADASWTDANAQAPSVGSGLTSGGAAEGYFAGRVWSVRMIDAWASGPYHARERWRHSTAMTPASVEWGLYRMEPPGLSSDMNSWELRAISDAMGVRDLAGRRREDRWEITQISEPSRTIWGPHRSEVLWTGGREFVRVGEEVIAVEEIFSGFYRVVARGMVGTRFDRPIEPGPASFVYLADSTLADASFRYSPGADLGGGTPSESRSSGTWTITSHWVPLILSILTSSADEADGLELTNYDPDVGNFSALPPGVGIGYPWHRVDWDSWVDAWKRTPDWTFDGFMLAGGEPVPFGELIEREFLRPLGAFLDEHRGKASIVLPRLPAAGDTLLELGPSTLLTRSVGRGRAVPSIAYRKTLASARTAVTFRVRSRSGHDVPITIADPSVLRLYGTRRSGLPFGSDTIEVPGVLVRDGESVPWLERLAARYLYYSRRSSWEVKASTTWDLESARRGEFVGVTDEQFPDLATGERGISARPARVEERTPVVQPGEPVRLDLRLLMVGAGDRVGRIAPSAMVVSSSGAGPYVVTVEANRYTDTDGPSDLPTADASGFDVGDVLRLTTRAGASSSGSTETISAISGNTITIGGSFGGALAAGLVLEYAGRSSMVAAQYNTTVIAADRASRTVGASTDDVWLYAQE